MRPHTTISFLFDIEGPGLADALRRGAAAETSLQETSPSRQFCLLFLGFRVDFPSFCVYAL